MPRYYPYLPWDDTEIHGDPINHDWITADPINHDRVHADTWLKEGIYGPYAVIIRWLTARDNKKLIADTRVLCVEQTVQ